MKVIQSCTLPSIHWQRSFYRKQTIIESTVCISNCLVTSGSFAHGFRFNGIFRIATIHYVKTSYLCYSSIIIGVSMHRKQPESISVQWTFNKSASPQYNFVVFYLIDVLVECVEWNASNRRLNGRQSETKMNTEREWDECTTGRAEIIQKI